MSAEQIGRRRRSIPLQTLQSKFDFYEQEANSQELYLPQIRTRGDERETKRTFELFKHATDGMRSTGQSIMEKLAADGRATESRILKDKINRKLQIVVEPRFHEDTHSQARTLRLWGPSIQQHHHQHSSIRIISSTEASVASASAA